MSDSADFALAGEDVYLFDLSAKVIPLTYIQQKTVSVSEEGATIDVVFTKTPVLADAPLSAASILAEDRRYILASDKEQYLFTRSRTDCVAEDGLLLTVPNTDFFWTFIKDGDGYLMRSASGKYLTAAMNGLNVVLMPVDDPGEGTYTQWFFVDGALSMDVEGTTRCLTYNNGQFALTANSAGVECRLYEIQS